VKDKLRSLNLPNPGSTQSETYLFWRRGSDFYGLTVSKRKIGLSDIIRMLAMHMTWVLRSSMISILPLHITVHVKLKKQKDHAARIQQELREQYFDKTIRRSRISWYCKEVTLSHSRSWKRMRIGWLGSYKTNLSLGYVRMKTRQFRVILETWTIIEIQD
jgi:hypothetical protein